MGIDYTAYAAIGVRVPAERLYVTHRKRACKHPLVVETAKHCAICGKEAYRSWHEPVAGNDEDNGTLHGFPLAPFCRMGSDDHWVVCIKGGLLAVDRHGRASDFAACASTNWLSVGRTLSACSSVWVGRGCRRTSACGLSWRRHEALVTLTGDW